MMLLLPYTEMTEFACLLSFCDCCACFQGLGDPSSNPRLMGLYLELVIFLIWELPAILAMPCSITAGISGMTMTMGGSSHEPSLKQ